MNLFSRVSIQEKILFARNMAVMTKAGIPILDCLRLVAKQTKSKAMVKILSCLSGDVANGQSLSSSLQKFRNVFGDFTINIIRIGESSGILYENLIYLAGELKKKRELRKKVVGTLTYPLIVVTASLGIIILLIFYVFPKILPILKSLKAEPPLPTKILMVTSEFMIHYGLYLGGAILIAVIAIWILISRFTTIRYLLHRFILITPLFNRISRNYNLATFSRTLGVLLKSDIKVVEALRITAGTMSNLVYRREIECIADDVSHGEEISRHLEKRSYVFPVTLAQMVAIGEKTGNLSESLLYLADFYEADLDDLTRDLSSTLEPVLMIILGVIVGFIAISIISPIYEVTQHL